MYSTCLHCHRALGRNDAIEAFPVGSRLAFDAAKGRLWVVCAHCARWNLTPIEERWEAVEQCERAFRSRRLRAQTDNVGLAALADGTELIRIGAPLRPEFAAWRYGRVLTGRLQRSVMIGAGATAVAGAAVASGVGTSVVVAAAAGGPILFLPAMWLILLAQGLRGRMLVTSVLGDDGRRLRVVGENLQHTYFRVNDDGRLALRLQHIGGRAILTGDRASRALAVLLARVNRRGGGSRTVRRATDLIGEAGDPQDFLARIAAETGAATRHFESRWAEHARGNRSGLQSPIGQSMWDTRTARVPRNTGALPVLPAATRLALEMALHESSEQHALETEMASLEQAWREAEEIAGIADGMLMPVPRATSR